MNLEVSATTNLPNERIKMPVFELWSYWFYQWTVSLSRLFSGFINFSIVEVSVVLWKSSTFFGLWFLAWNLGRNWLLTSSYFSYFLCRLKFNGFTSRKNLSSVNISSLWRKSLSCSAKRTELQIFFFLILDLWRAKPLSIRLIQFCSSFVNPNPDGKYGNYVANVISNHL